MKTTLKLLAVAAAAIASWWACRSLILPGMCQTGMEVPRDVQVSRAIFNILWLPWCWIPNSWHEATGMVGMQGEERLASFVGILWAAVVAEGLSVALFVPRRSEQRA